MEFWENKWEPRKLVIMFVYIDMSGLSGPFQGHKTTRQGIYFRFVLILSHGNGFTPKREFMVTPFPRSCF